MEDGRHEPEEAVHGGHRRAPMMGAVMEDGDMGLKEHDGLRVMAYLGDEG